MELKLLTRKRAQRVREFTNLFVVPADQDRQHIGAQPFVCPKECSCSLVAAVVYLRLHRNKQGGGKPILKELKSDKGPKMVALQDEKAEQVTASI